MRTALHLALLSFLIDGCVPQLAYEPMRSAQAPTECPNERGRAHDARDNLLHYGTIANRYTVAETVFAHAVCEAAVLSRVEVASGANTIETHLEPLRQQYINAFTLFAEVQRYQTELWDVASLAGTATLDLEFARRLRDSGYDDMAVQFQNRASRSHRRLLQRVARRPSFLARYPEAGAWLAQACRLERPDQHAACR